MRIWGLVSARRLTPAFISAMDRLLSSGTDLELQHFLHTLRRPFSGPLAEARELLSGGVATETTSRGATAPTRPHSGPLVPPAVEACLPTLGGREARAVGEAARRFDTTLTDGRIELGGESLKRLVAFSKIVPTPLVYPCDYREWSDWNHGFQAWVESCGAGLTPDLLGPATLRATLALAVDSAVL